MRTLLVAAVGTLIAFTSAAGQAAPKDVVARYQEGLLSVMKRAASLGFQGRFQALAPVVGDAYHMATVARRSVGAATWRSMTDDQRRRYVAAFRDFSVANHAARFKGHGGERFEITGEKQIGAGQVLVRTRIGKPGGTQTAINYLLIQSGGRWGIADVFLRGSISEVATRRAEFSSIVRSRGVDGLIDALKRKTAALRS